MQYAQLNEALTEATQITSNGNVEWDANNFCTAAALVKDGKADQFRVVELLETPAPAIDAMIQRVYRNGCEFVADQWQYKWTVEDLTAEQIAAKQAAETARLREVAKVARAAQVEQIQVTTQAGNTFDGDEMSQGRMARAVIALSTGLAPSVTWVLADNTTIQATPAELTEALVLAGQAQAAIWVI